MFKCGDVVKDRLSTYNSGIEVLVIIGISESILTDVCNVELKQSEKQFIKDTKKRVIYVCKHITYIDDTMPEEYNNEYISKCLSYSMQNTFTNVTKCFPMDISFMYHIDDFETYLIKNRMLTNLDLHLVSEGQMVQHAKEYYHHEIGRAHV